MSAAANASAWYTESEGWLGLLSQLESGNNWHTLKASVLCSLWLIWSTAVQALVDDIFLRVNDTCMPQNALKNRLLHSGFSSAIFFAILQGTMQRLTAFSRRLKFGWSAWGTRIWWWRPFWRRFWHCSSFYWQSSATARLARSPALMLDSTVPSELCCEAFVASVSACSPTQTFGEGLLDQIWQKLIRLFRVEFWFACEVLQAPDGMSHVIKWAHKATGVILAHL